jgi:hypothetical protein
MFAAVFETPVCRNMELFGQATRVVLSKKGDCCDEVSLPVSA